MSTIGASFSRSLTYRVTSLDTRERTSTLDKVLGQAVTQLIDTDSDDRGEAPTFDSGLDDAGLLEAVVGHYRGALVSVVSVHT